MKAFDQTIRAFLTESAADVPTPGGGSAAALTAALGASMGAMAARFTKGPAFREAEGAMQRAVRRMAEAADACEELLEADMAAFEQYLAAARLPKASAAEQRVREAALQEAAAAAAETPLRLLLLCRDAAAALHPLAADVSRQVASDLGIGVLLLEAAAQSAKLTVDINLAAVPGDAAGRLGREAEAAARDIACIKEAALQIIRGRIRE